MMALPIAGAVALFLVLVILLLSLNLASLWKWWIKAGAIVIAIAGIVVLYFVFTGVVGWASTGAMPERFSLLLSRPIDLLARLLGPIVSLLNGITRWVARSICCRVNRCAPVGIRSPERRPAASSGS